MAKARAIVKRLKAVRNIRKITRTMELIATARFKKAMDRTTEAEAFTRKITELAADLSRTAGSVSHPLLQAREQVKTSLLHQLLDGGVGAVDQQHAGAHHLAEIVR